MNEMLSKAFKDKLLVLDGINIFSTVYYTVAQEVEKYFLADRDISGCYDWVITEAIRRVLSAEVITHVQSHTRNDVYLCVFEAISSEVYQALNLFINGNDLQFLKGKVIKVLVTPRYIVIADVN